MRRELIVIAVLSAIWFSVWYSVDSDMNFKKLQIIEAFEETPIIAFSFNDQIIEDYTIWIDSLNLANRYVNFTETQVKDSLLTKYDLTNSKRLLKSVDLPNVTEIYPNFDAFSENDINSVMTKIDKYNKQLIVDYNRADLLKKYNDVRDLNRNKTLYFLVFLILSIFMVFFLRYLVEIHQAHNWKVFIEAGGSESKLIFMIARNTLTVVALSLLVNLIFCILHDYLLLNRSVSVNVPLYGLFVAVQILGNIGAGLYIKDKIYD